MLMVQVPWIIFDGRRIYLERKGNTMTSDPTAEKVAVDLGKILKERIFNKSASTEPKIIQAIDIGLT